MPAILVREVVDLVGSNLSRRVRVNINGESMAVTGCSLTDEGNLELSTANTDAEDSVDLAAAVSEEFPTSGDSSEEAQTEEENPPT